MCYCYFINTIIIVNPSFSRVLKIFIVSLVITSSLLKCFFITLRHYLLSLIIQLIKLEIVSLLPKHVLKDLLNLSATRTNL